MTKSNRPRLRCAALMLALLLTACAAPPQPLPEPVLPAREAPLTLAVATDLHFLPERLVRDGEAFHAAWAYGDGKQINHITALTEALVDQLLADPPDGVLLTGDLTLNGEREGHLELARRLLPLRQAGIPVLVIPGNHDIGNAFAAGYNRGKTYSVRTVGRRNSPRSTGSLATARPSAGIPPASATPTPFRRGCGR